MKAIVYEKYGSPDVLELEEIEKPTPKEDEVLVKVHAAAITPMDWHFMTGTPAMARLMAGLLKPKNMVLGTQVAGKVEAVGGTVKRYQGGDEVFGISSNCGGYAEYVCILEAEAYPKPADLSFEETIALLFSAITALICLCDLGQLQAGQNVLINGASGGVGTQAVQIAKFVGAKVTGVCSTRNLDLVSSLGADQVIDYTQEDFSQSDVRYDLVFDTAGKRSFTECQRVLTADGIYVTTEFSPMLAIKGKWVSMTGSQKMIPMTPVPPKAEIKELFEQLLMTGKLKPIIDRCFPLSETPEAFRYYETKHTPGRVIITV
jgi:NADPH:quinone reductase-like Zn-dependent oxidoreductase